MSGFAARGWVNTQPIGRAMPATKIRARDDRSHRAGATYRSDRLDFVLAAKGGDQLGDQFR